VSVDASIDDFLDANDPELISYKNFQQEYGQDVDDILLLEGYT